MAKHVKEEEELRQILPHLLTRFSFEDLQSATEGFSKLLGSGGFGSVYAGMLADGRKVAVKVLESLARWQSKQFLAEIATIGRTNHQNIVCLVGFCWEEWHRLLVYEYVELGSLDRPLFAKDEPLDLAHGGKDAIPTTSPELLDWTIRYNIALGIVRGLSYLHDECPRPILHLDIKPQNILLDAHYVAKLADFGMSKLMQKDVSEVLTGARGTLGYIAPEWILRTGAASKKSDIYSMGVVLLEIVGGRRNIDLTMLNQDNAGMELEEAWHFLGWASKKCEQGQMMELVDKRLQISGFDEEQVQRLVYTAFWCIHRDPNQRPYAHTVIKWLEGSCVVEEPPFNSISECHGAAAAQSFEDRLPGSARS